MVAGSQLEKDSYFSKLSAAVVKVVLGFWDSPAAEVDENLLSWKKKKKNFIKSLTLKYRKHKVLRHHVGGSQEWPKLPQSSLTSQKMKSPEANGCESPGSAFLFLITAELR